MFTTSVSCRRRGRACNSFSRSMFTLWPFKWTLLFLVMLLMNKVAAKWPPDSQSKQHHFDDFAIDSNAFGNEKSINGNGNVLLDKAIAEGMALRDFVQPSDVTVPAEERRQRQLQWLGSWLFGQRQQQPHRLQAYLLPEQLQQPKYALKPQLSPHSNDIGINDAGFVIYKKAPEIVPSERDKLVRETDAVENDVIDEQVGEEDADKQVSPMATIDLDYDYKSNTDPLAEQTPRSKRIFYPHYKRSMDAYAYIPYTAYQHDRERELAEAKKFTFKRNKTGNGDQRNFLPSISAGAMTHLGSFFTDLSKNVRYNEKSQQLGHEEAKLLEGQHPLRQLHEKIAGEHEANAEFLHAIRTYRPSQKIRSLVAMNPRGYHGAQFIDPNYMWVGLGK